MVIVATIIDEEKRKYYFLFNLNDAEEVKRAKAINEEWSRILYKEIPGVPPPQAMIWYRVGPDTAKVEMPKLGEYYKLLVKLKRTLDPNRIMNPGHLMDIEPF
jgi:FAD/FMN-containing dehydrogenase